MMDHPCSEAESNKSEAVAVVTEEMILAGVRALGFTDPVAAIETRRILTTAYRAMRALEPQDA